MQLVINHGCIAIYVIFCNYHWWAANCLELALLGSSRRLLGRHMHFGPRRHRGRKRWPSRGRPMSCDRHVGLFVGLGRWLWWFRRRWLATCGLVRLRVHHHRGGHRQGVVVARAFTQVGRQVQRHAPVGDESVVVLRVTFESGHLKKIKLQLVKKNLQQKYLSSAYYLRLI